MRSNRYVNFIFFLLLGSSASAQWNGTPSPTVAYRYDDVYFINPDVGWAVHYATSTTNGNVIKTTDGGASWQTVLTGTGAAFRDIAFTDSLHGWIGTLQDGQNPQDTIIMYQTVDGGLSWSPVPNFPGPRPAGICGMCVINDSTVYACGRYKGEPGFYKTTDNGQSWSYTDMSAYAGGLVDIYFMTPDSGFIVGTSNYWFTDSGRILFTSDGGATWQIRHTSAHLSEICWKISFPSPNVGYVSLESFRGSGPQYFLKTTDGGQTWQDLPFMSSGSYDAEGIGFINDTIGWIGGGNFNYKTMNGGMTWTIDNSASTVNRFRFFGDTLGFAAGRSIYRFDSTAVGVQEHPAAENRMQAFPNPVSGELTLLLQQLTTNARVDIFDATGKCVSATTGITGRELHLDASDLSPGLYLVRLQDAQGSTVIRFVKE